MSSVTSSSSLLRKSHIAVYMGTVLFPSSYIIEQSKAPNSVSQSSPTHVFLFSWVTHREYREVLSFPILTQSHARVSIYPRMEILSLPNEPNTIEFSYLLFSSFNKSVVSPCQNNNACSSVQVFDIPTVY
jgi:hypothetical protein